MDFTVCVRQAFAFFDKDSNDMVDKDEWLEKLGVLLDAAQQERFAALWGEFDADESGALNKDEFATMLGKLMADDIHIQIKLLWAIADKDANGLLSKEEFYEWVRILLENDKDVEEGAPILEKLFAGEAGIDGKVDFRVFSNCMEWLLEE